MAIETVAPPDPPDPPELLPPPLELPPPHPAKRRRNPAVTKDTAEKREYDMGASDAGIANVRVDEQQLGRVALDSAAYLLLSQFRRPIPRNS
jgi:hypothetical protein